MTLSNALADCAIKINRTMEDLLPGALGAEAILLDAILINKGKKHVYVLKDNKAIKKAIKIGRSVGERFEVIEGLIPGDITITRGNERLRPGETVKSVN